MARRSSLGVPVSTLIFPRSAADRSEANKLTKAMEEKYGFHYVTNSFTQDPLVELDFQAYYTETNLTPALYASLICWLMWITLSTPDWVGYYDDDPDVRAASELRLWISAFIYIPVPTVVACCRSRYFIGYEQTLLCLIAHCFAAGILGQGLINADDYTRVFLKDLKSLFSLAFNEPPETDWRHSEGSHTSPNNDTIVLNGSTEWWIYQDLESSGHDLVLTYINRVAIPMAHLNMNLLRPLVVLLVAPLFKLDAFHYLLLAFVINVEFCILVSLQYPASSSTIFVVNKFLLIFTLVCVSAVLVVRVRQTDRFLRLNFLHAKIVEERARASHLQKEIILNENKSLKKMLEERVGGHGDGSPPLDFDSPMAKVLLDLKALQRATELSPELRENLDGIVTLLMRKGQNLFAPDIHEQLKMKRDGDLDGDIKSWATTVLANKSYTRNRRASAVFQNSIENPASIKDSDRSMTASSSNSSVSLSPTNRVETRLHPEVTAPTDEVLNAVGELMERDGWSVDTFEVARLTNNKPISFITYIAFEQHNLFDLCSVNKDTLANFLHFLDIGYHRNPYHNNCHAADVVSSVEYLISVMDNGYLQDLLTYQEVFAAIIAAAIHDFRHPGKNNNFMIKSGSDLAIEFSDSSVLERMHLSEAFFLAKDPLFNIFVGLSPGQYSEVRKAIVEMVLSTDLTVHLQLVGSLKTALISQEDAEVEHSPMLLMKIVIKCADLGHSSKALKLHSRWSDLIIEEFFLQGDDEHTLGMDISPFMNRNSENSARNQVGFFEFIVLPFFEVVAEAVFRPEFKTILDQAHQNYKLWKKADNMQINSIKDILDQVLDPEAAKTAKTLVGH
ncbi:hypothetical protein F442_21305 [Phytophthora nicotianae P10297]|uniref:Phosphodiesterase n=4 Tax=Phytophthora nicotianae TaxID=4792 RepID=W2QTY1_PHYN3|nr:hypothetical protein PPTG_06212 [Phytophthora nicotianae INRA-310]ETI31549.1 hypothetical protein F443_21469 [Phytophthora nicotianae P1569]ETK71942.1 hypothetical protein L915_20873 [Phytophthora nicotianae]ETP29525.1 hypothetical protein F442_21305 [Phytophthora nicotianae P10297]ETL78596.1 hypothetical protein L917_20606 [Phytophthora nicotianae]ETN15954.1 hypothetical protein PPTG_06212 [Phytophthora nicotianae INRA-310]